MKISRITQWRQRLAHPRLTSGLFPSPLPDLPRDEEPELVDLRDPEEQRKLLEPAPLSASPAQESWLTVTLVCVAAAVLFLLLLVCL